MISVGTKPRVKVDETSTEEKQDLLSSDMNRQYEIWCLLMGMGEIQIQINIGRSHLSFCDKSFKTEHMYLHIQMLMITSVS